MLFVNSSNFEFEKSVTFSLNSLLIVCLRRVGHLGWARVDWYALITRLVDLLQSAFVWGMFVIVVIPVMVYSNRLVDVILFMADILDCLSPED